MIDLENFEDKDLTRYQRMMLARFKIVYLGDFSKPGWSGDLPFYAFRCKQHGLVVDYKHGHDERLSCPKCVAERIKSINST